MGCNLVQCKDCGQFNKEGTIYCNRCGGSNLTIGFHQLLNVLGIKKENKNGKSSDDGKL